MKRIGKEKTLSMIMFLFGLLFFVMTIQIPSTQSQFFDSRFMPLVMSIILMALGITRFIKYRNEEVVEKAKVDYKTLFTTIILLILYIFAYSKLGFVIASGLFIFLEILNLKPKYIEYTKVNYLALIVFSLIFPVLIYYLFYFGFKIVLPAGLLYGIL
ncbi:tripartite tricarboxylate transporter TctB family protein [Anaerococcus lactolyticus]|uniref:DUF1468 domain-containing protein n=1 Tax=Anaerococcus lactolyticus S7-1-13 TaxID=1284686 RepID=A0A095Z960_9FIRM|nr:tripartite tricarboxylate transporter TctB family protein [Anaerococcus lactolyticus]KGF05009.1 hypothetical protein HMPREF1630_01725 [Anaerococcus lactolyticus S7-1-13]